MKYATTSSFSSSSPARTIDGLRPVLAEGHLMTDKHVCDRAYVANLVQELEGAERRISNLEESLRVNCESTARDRPCRLSPGHTDANAIREFSGQLSRRLHRLQLPVPETRQVKSDN